MREFWTWWILRVPAIFVFIYIYLYVVEDLSSLPLFPFRSVVAWLHAPILLFLKAGKKEELRAPYLSSQNILRGSQLSWFFNRNPGLSTLEKSDV